MSASLQELEEEPSLTVSDGVIYMILFTGSGILKQMSIHADRTRKPGALHSSSLQTNAGQVPQVKRLNSDSFIWTCKPQPELTKLIIFWAKRIHQGAHCFLAKTSDEMEGLTKIICTCSEDFEWAKFHKLRKLYSEAGRTEVPKRKEGLN